MKSLELKIPPLLVTVLIGLAMWGVSLIAPSLEIPRIARLSLALAIALAGGVFILAGAVSFRLARTTVNPMKPESASALVNSGIYRITRNPMYVAMLLGLVAWAVFLSSPLALLGPLCFGLYIDRFQIQPEERALSAKFGADFAVYKTKVRRWL